MDIKVIQTNERTEVNISAISADDSKTIDFILKVIEGCRPIASPDLRPQHYPSACNTEGSALVDEHLRKRARTHLLRHKPL